MIASALANRMLALTVCAVCTRQGKHEHVVSICLSEVLSGLRSGEAHQSRLVGFSGQLDLLRLFCLLHAGKPLLGENLGAGGSKARW